MTANVERRRQIELLDLPSATEVPIFSSEAEEADFWASHDTSLLWNLGEDVSDNPPSDLRRRPPGVASTARKRPPDERVDLVSIRLPAGMIDEIKTVAERRNLPHQTLIRAWIGERLAREQTAAGQDNAPGPSANV